MYSYRNQLEVQRYLAYNAEGMENDIQSWR